MPPPGYPQPEKFLFRSAWPGTDPVSMPAPRELMTIPFVGSTAITKGLLTRRQLQSDTWRRLLPDIYAWAELTIDHHLRCHAAGLYLRGRGAVSGRSAAAFWGADTLIRGEPIEVTVPAEVRI